MTDACKTCAFYEDHAGAAKDDNTGLCHFNPPVPTEDKRALWPG